MTKRPQQNSLHTPTLIAMMLVFYHILYILTNSVYMHTVLLTMHSL